MKRNRFSFLSIRLFHKGEVGGAFVVVIICQRELLQWAVVKRLHTLDVEGVEEMLTTSKWASAVYMAGLFIMFNTSSYVFTFFNSSSIIFCRKKEDTPFLPFLYPASVCSPWLLKTMLLFLLSVLIAKCLEIGHFYQNDNNKAKNMIKNLSKAKMISISPLEMVVKSNKKTKFQFKLWLTFYQILNPLWPPI